MIGVLQSFRGWIGDPYLLGLLLLLRGGFLLMELPLQFRGCKEKKRKLLNTTGHFFVADKLMIWKKIFVRGDTSFRSHLLVKSEASLVTWYFEEVFAF